MKTSNFILSICSVIILTHNLYAGTSQPKIQIKSKELKSGAYSTQCYIKNNKTSKLIYDTGNPVQLDTIIYIKEEPIFILNEDIHTEEMASNYIVYDFSNDVLYQSDFYIALDSLSPEDLKRIRDDIRLSVFYIDSLDTNLQYLYLHYKLNNKVNKLKLDKIEQLPYIRK